ncbi:MAG: carbohydrate-binding domain-containing protein, partial [Treponemataceae bacterium]|nr:carbohydrate-binding domain-containing protein [Treponemataceae bacterium]
DDGINAASDDTGVSEHIIIICGQVTVDAGVDGIDSNGSILVSGGTVTVYGSTSGSDAGLDADSGIVVNGGTLFATSTLGMVETPSTNSAQCVVSYAHQSQISAGAVVTLRGSDGSTLLSMPVKKNCQSIIFSTPALKTGGTYALYSGNTRLTSFTVSSVITTIGTSGSAFPGGNGGIRPYQPCETFPPVGEDEFQPCETFPPVGEDEFQPCETFPPVAENEFQAVDSFPSFAGNKFQAVFVVPTFAENEFQAVASLSTIAENEFQAVASLPSIAENEFQPVSSVPPVAGIEFQPVFSFPSVAGKSAAFFPTDRLDKVRGNRVVYWHD